MDYNFSADETIPCWDQTSQIQPDFGMTIFFYGPQITTIGPNINLRSSERASKRDTIRIHQGGVWDGPCHHDGKSNMTEFSRLPSRLLQVSMSLAMGENDLTLLTDRTLEHQKGLVGENLVVFFSWTFFVSKQDI